MRHDTCTVPAKLMYAYLYIAVNVATIRSIFTKRVSVASNYGSISLTSIVFKVMDNYLQTFDMCFGEV